MHLVGLVFHWYLRHYFQKLHLIPPAFLVHSEASIGNATKGNLSGSDCDLQFLVIKYQRANKLFGFIENSFIYLFL